MTPAELRAARHALGLSAAGMARLLRMAPSSGRTVRRWEAGEQDIPGGVVVIIRGALEVPAFRRWLGI